MPRSAGDLVGGKYRLVTILASGGMGAVWVARHTELAIDVAIKFRSEAGKYPENRGEMRFRREAQLAARLRSPHVVHIYDFDVDAGEPYMAMELLVGEDLKHRMEREGVLSLADVSTLLTQVAKGLACAHDAGIIHRDLKPANLFLAHVGGEEVVKILDFGIAKHDKLPDLEDTTTGVVMGSPAYMSPEQTQGNAADQQADLWALSVITFLALTGTHPFKGKTYADTVQRICLGRFPKLSEVAREAPRGLDEFFSKTFAREARRRFATASELSRALSDLAKRHPNLALTPRGAESGEDHASRGEAAEDPSAEWRSSVTRSVRAAPASRQGVLVRRSVTAAAALALGVTAVTVMWAGRQPPRFDRLAPTQGRIERALPAPASLPESSEPSTATSASDMARTASVPGADDSAVPTGPPTKRPVRGFHGSALGRATQPVTPYVHDPVFGLPMRPGADGKASKLE